MPLSELTQRGGRGQAFVGGEEGGRARSGSATNVVVTETWRQGVNFHDSFRVADHPGVICEQVTPGAPTLLALRPWKRRKLVGRNSKASSEACLYFFCRSSCCGYCIRGVPRRNAGGSFTRLEKSGNQNLTQFAQFGPTFNSMAGHASSATLAAGSDGMDMVLVDPALARCGPGFSLDEGEASGPAFSLRKVQL
jgi:hypothetical protein